MAAVEALRNVSFCGQALCEPSEAKAELCANCETSANREPKGGEKILPSSRASREMSRSSHLARKAPGMQATETQVKLDVITGGSQEKNAKPMSARSSNSFPFELSICTSMVKRQVLSFLFMH